MQSNTTTKTYPCKVDSRWYWSLESACIGVTSPKGKTLWLQKKNRHDKNMTSAHWNLLNELHSRLVDESSGTLDLTRAEMEMLKEIYDIQNPEKPVRHESFRQRKFKAVRESQRGGIRAGICGCGGKLNMNNHGTWTGYCCTQCGQGGSFNHKY